MHSCNVEKTCTILVTPTCAPFKIRTGSGSVYIAWAIPSCLRRLFQTLADPTTGGHLFNNSRHNVRHSVIGCEIGIERGIIQPSAFLSTALSVDLYESLSHAPPGAHLWITIIYPAQLYKLNKLPIWIQTWCRRHAAFSRRDTPHPSVTQIGQRGRRRIHPPPRHRHICIQIGNLFNIRGGPWTSPPTWLGLWRLASWGWPYSPFSHAFRLFAGAVAGASKPASLASARASDSKPLSLASWKTWKSLVNVAPQPV